LTWSKNDGVPIVHYSSQEPGARAGKHAENIDGAHFKSFLDETREIDFDLMLEIKSKELAAKTAIRIAQKDSRFLERTI
jgi:UV DNA damage endonuclease